MNKENIYLLKKNNKPRCNLKINRNTGLPYNYSTYFSNFNKLYLELFDGKNVLLS